jgi:hypothetical protein
MNRGPSLFSWVTLVILVLSIGVAANTIHVPADQPTIQAAINVASNGDTILVSPGLYRENINFIGKAITVSALTPGTATIDGNENGSVVTFNHSETANSVLQGFVIQDGYATGAGGGGINIASASPTIQNNTIAYNNAGIGAGIFVSFSSPSILNNSIVSNTSIGSGGYGIGIAINGTGTAQIIGNLIANNNGPGCSFGGGISLDGANAPLIENNIIRNNFCYDSGGGIGFVNDSPALVVQNLIYGNRAQQGAGISMLVPYGIDGPTLVNNTVINNTGSTAGSALYIEGFPNFATMYNNVFTDSDNETAIYCDSSYSGESPQFHHNLAYSAQGTNVYGPCTAGFPGDGNLEQDPDLDSNFRVLGHSPIINQGDRQAPSLPDLDLYGNPRLGYYTSGTGSLELGVYAYVPVAFSMPNLAFPPTRVGSKKIQSLVVHNYSQDPATILYFQVTGDFSRTTNCSRLPVDGECYAAVIFAPRQTGPRTGQITIWTTATDQPTWTNLSGQGSTGATIVSSWQKNVP